MAGLNFATLAAKLPDWGPLNMLSGNLSNLALGRDGGK